MRAAIGPAAEAASRRRGLLGMAAAYTLFVVYGSLVPLSFEPRPLAEAWARFREMPTLTLGIVSRADWVSNILLFIPLGFLWQERWAAGRGVVGRTLVTAWVWAACVLLSLGIEFTQIFFPPRTVSRNDVLAEGIGAAIGLTAWWLFGARVRVVLSKLLAARGAAGLAERALWIYLGLLLLYNVMPLDLTISPAEIYHKWKEGRVVLNPFRTLGTDPAGWLYGVASDVAIWAPVALLWIVGRRGDPASALGLTVTAAAGIEAVQLLIFTRVSDVGDVATAALGGAVGVAIGTRVRRALPERKPSEGVAARRAAWLGLLAAAGWIGVLAALFWYPYDFRLERAFVLERLALFREVPFLSYWRETEFRALGGLLRRVLLFLPLGVALAIASRAAPSRGTRRAAAAACALLIAVTAAAIEVGQAFLPGKYPDTTDLCLEALGGLAGFALYTFARARLSPAGGRGTA